MDAGEAKASPATATRARQVSERVAPSSKPLPDLPAEVADDVARLIGFDAALRSDGKIARSKIDEGMQRLRRAYEKHGLEALLEGIEVAINKGKGLAFAAGCVRARGADHKTTLFSESLEEDLPPRFDDYEAPPEKIWRGAAS